MTDRPRQSTTLLGFRMAALGLAISLASAGEAPGQSPPARAFVPFSEPPIDYLSAEVADPVGRLQERIDKGEAALRHEPKRGYLDSVLQSLGIPVSSQTLVFSKTSLQYRKISPKTPRALYFNDNVYVGWVPGANILEISSFDPNQGAIFYQVDQQPSDSPVFLRATIDCTQCHVSRETRGVPGVFLRSVLTSPTGSQWPRTRTLLTGHESPLEERFGGWYVTGTHGQRTHMGNVAAADREHPDVLDRAAGANVVDLAARFPTGDYASPHSDLVANLVLAHQTQMHNLITLVNFKARIALHAARREGAVLGPAARQAYEEPAEELVRYLLFADEAPLDGPVAGTTTYARDFATLGPRDDRGRSLRDFDLERRLFRHPCSYLIYSEAFDALPEPARNFVYKRLLEVLTSLEPAKGYERLAAADRRAILEILLATKPNLPEEWRRLRATTAAGSPPPGPAVGSTASPAAFAETRALPATLPALATESPATP